MQTNKPMGREGGLWTIVLATGQGGGGAAGDGEVPVHLQAQPGGTTLLHDALQRAACLAPERRLRVMVAREHRQWWQWQLADLHPSCIVEVPSDRGAAACILVALTLILREDPEASVVVLPAESQVQDELVLHEALAVAAQSAREHLAQILLLGMAPPEDESTACDWLVPQRQTPPFGLSPVARVRADPDEVEAASLRAEGALAKSSILVARGSTLRALFEQHLPALALRFCLWRGDGPSLPGLFGSIHHYDLTHDLLQPSLERLSVVSVPPCGWTDLQWPERPAHKAPAGWRSEPGFVPPPELSQLFASARRAA
jgi:hypothetical protein